jgi:glucan phosphoethanolaminetransferase (alkaline phosphatase superfamily)
LKEQENKILNFGVIDSCHSSSHYSVKGLTTLISSDDLENDDVNGTSIFQFAKHAGYQTVFVDFLGVLRDGFVHEDMSYVDHQLFLNVLYPNASYTERDFHALDELEKLFDTPLREEPYLVVIVKNGAHFPYNKTYPAGYREFEPLMKRFDNFYSPAERIINSYYNSLKYNVDEYWKKIFNIYSKKEVIWVYTSDHAQKVPPEKEGQTYGGGHPDMKKVPLWLYSNIKSPDELLILVRKYDALKNGEISSHYDIFRLMVSVMGFSLDRK